LALDESKETDKKFEFGELTFLIEENLLSSTGGVRVDYMDDGFRAGFMIQPKVPLSGGAPTCGGGCSTC